MNEFDYAGMTPFGRKIFSSRRRMLTFLHAKGSGTYYFWRRLRAGQMDPEPKDQKYRYNPYRSKL